MNGYFCHIENRYKEHVLIFTDGSKDAAAGATGAAEVLQGLNVEIYKRTSKYLIVYTVEYAIFYGISVD